MFSNARASLSLRVLAAFVLCTLLTASLYAQDTSSLTWSRVKLTSGPAARASFASAYDPVSKKVVLFGGYDATGPLNETWTFDGAHWAKINTSVAPTARFGTSFAYDFKIHKLVLFGGTAGFGVLNDTWLWDGATSKWTQASPQNLPAGASNPILFSDPVNGHVVMFGGYRGRFYSRDTFQWTGTDWVLLNPTNSPFPRSGAIAAYDPVHKNVVLFGGISDNWIVQNTWTWDGSDWTQQNPATQPPPLYFTKGGFYPPLQSVIVFGGGSEGVDQDTTWAWDGTDWSQLSPLRSPAAREQLGTVVDPTSRQFLTFGGTDFDSGALLGDVWKLTGK
jgi:hypothetical protein